MEEAKRVIVTGATGLIGSRLCRELLTHGYTVVVFSRHPEAARTQVPGAATYVAWQPAESGSWAEHNRDFAQTLAQAVGKPARLATPGLLLRMWLGVTAETILYGRRVVPKKALDLGYQFQFPTLSSALGNLLSTKM